MEHPFSTSSIALQNLLNQCIDEPVYSSRMLHLKLPVCGTLPCGSPEWAEFAGILLRRPDEPWYYGLPAVECMPEALLCMKIPFHLSRPDPPLGFSIPSNLDPEGGFIQGGTLRFWTAVATLASEMVARGRYLPTIDESPGAVRRLLWRPVFSSYDNSRIFSLARAMPDINRIFVAENQKTATDAADEEVIRIFITNMINRIVSLSVHQFIPSLKDRKRSDYIISQEFIALWNLYGFVKADMPKGTPRIKASWSDKFTRWVSDSASTIPDDSPWQVCLSLEEQEGDGSLALKVMIKKNTDPDTLYTPTHLFEKSDRCQGLLNQKELDRAVRTILIRLAKISPSLSLQDLGPDPVFSISKDEVMQFLTDDLQRIRDAGIEILLPSIWSGVSRVQVRLTVREAPDTKPLFGIESLLDFDYQVAIGDQILTYDEFRRLVDLKQSCIRLANRFYTFNADQLTRVMKEVQRWTEAGRFTALDLLRSVANPDPDAGVVILPGDTWTEQIAAMVTEGLHPDQVSVPSTFEGELRHYQLTGLSFLLTRAKIGFGACLADDMGLGKTPQTIAFLLEIREKGLFTGPSLLICPTSVIGNWERELERFAPTLTHMLHYGPKKAKSSDFYDQIKDYNLVITTYEVAKRDGELLSSIKWAGLILDEAQNIKNVQTKRFQAVRCLNAGFRIALTGTPVENRLTELWAIMEILNPGYLGSKEEFRRYFALPIESEQNPERMSELRRLIRPFLMRRVKSDPEIISDLPEKMEMRIYCTITADQAAMYQATVDRLTEEMVNSSRMERSGRILAALTRLKQVCDHPALVTKDEEFLAAGSGKVMRLIEMLDEVREEGEAAIIFTQYARFATRLSSLIQDTLGEETLLLTGATKRENREYLIQRFMDEFGPKFFVISLKAGGTGLNLMRASHVFHIDRWWNPAVEDQATDRAYRIGQTKNVQVHLMIAAGTLEERIDEMIQRKRSLADQVLTGGEAWLTEIPTGELLEVLRLREEVFGDDY